MHKIERDSSVAKQTLVFKVYTLKTINIRKFIKDEFLDNILTLLILFVKEKSKLYTLYNPYGIFDLP